MTRVNPVRRFAEIADSVPTRLAVADDTGGVAYRDLAGLAGGRARSLAEAGIGVGARVGLLTTHGTPAIAAILGTLATGAAYVPLDPGFPPARLRHQLAVAGVTTVLADPEHAAAAENLGVPTVLRTDERTAPLPVPADAPDELAYVLFTSGSTGTPKAIAQTHRNLAHCVDNQIAALGIGAADRVSLLASFAFDAAIPDLYPALLTGATVVPVDVRAVGVAATAQALDRHGVTVYHSTPTLYRYLLDALGGTRLAAVRTVLLGGEQATHLDLHRGRDSFAPDCVFVNGYGMTEATFVAHHRLPAAAVDPSVSGPLPIGSALPGFELALTGGEIEVRGHHLVAGYLGQDSDAFGVLPDGRRSYRTGDLGEITEDGTLVCLGRRDRQVKVRGFRVEPAEVEAALAALPGVRAARVIVRDGDLIGYVEADVDPGPLRAAVAERLPQYAVPTAVVRVDRFPLTVTGKLDERALPAPGTPAPAQILVSATERRVHAVWCAVLGRDGVGRTDAFFDAGGNSLLLNDLQRRLSDEFGAEIALLDLFEHATVAAQAAHLDRASSTVDAGVGPVADPADLPSDLPSDLIAVVGMAGRFPGAPDVASFWWNLCAGVDAIHDYTADELAALGIGPGFVRAGGRLDGVEDFDAEFFGFTAEEAASTDPQHRLFLEAAWQALEDAGRDPATEPGPVGVFASSSVNRYFLFHLFGNPAVRDVDPGDWEARLLGRQLTDHLPGQVAYRLGLTGPALAVQSACSSSLAAVGLAAQSLADYRCDLALAGGVSVTWPRYRAGGLVSADGRCRAFDERADGSGFSSGVGVVALRRLADAIADRDHVYAVLPGWAMTNDGPDRAGFAVPGTAGQAAAIAEALTIAQVRPDEVRLVEAHGSGTPMGDAIEVAALNRVYRGAAPAGWTALGSVKTNIGHLDAAAGVAGLVKAALAVRHGVIPPNLHFTAPHPQVALGDGPFFVPSKLADWPDGGRRVAGVSSFGMGGTNVHVLVEQPPLVEPTGDQAGPYLLPVSARDPKALREAVSRLREHLAGGGDALADVAFTLAVGRRAFDRRAAVVAHTKADALAALAVLTEDAPVAGVPGELFELARRWVGGAAVELPAGAGRRVPLPTYPFQRDRYWIDPPVRN
ncbi:beta-ketoacyl synthase N-terminal-like domain-containing protein [Labedaea rhizosphaerae]|uniref:Amino acid adenylation domain-containing protein n=1 Tax=Labedaea rhizosphaerae TaxID=598644 RepID=A0A4R6RQK9_LABRH|nr:beta-ketoacyl synthase N-terminal-like domain-containing protein [Labedaea rhizosphaerae]TDP89071.1 amino acid adenylation domain-containing protein [Labedaea rhizosphaerae]